MKGLSLLLLCLCVCSSLTDLTAGSDDTCNSKEKAILIARDAIAEREEWPHGADYSVSRDPSGWRVAASRIDYPGHKGSARYAPDGFRLILIDNSGELRKYSR